MNLLGYNLIGALRQRLGAVVASFAGAAACCLCGALMAFVFAPGQAVRAANVSRLPQMDAATVQSAAPGDTLLITGVLTGNDPLPETSALVAYRAERFSVRAPNDTDDGPSEPSGSWTSIGSTVPDLTLDMNGQPVQLLEAANVRLTGPLHEEIVPGAGLTAEYQNETIADGTVRYAGLADGDQTTVLGTKVVSGGVTPEQLFAGNRAAFEASEKGAASNFLISGICAMAMAPVVLVGGILLALFGRRR